MNNPETQVREYLEAISDRDFELARTFLADDDFSYISPIARFDDADRFIEQVSAIGPILEQIKIRRLFVSEPEVIVIADALITLHGYVTRTTAILFQTKNEAPS